MVTVVVVVVSVCVVLSKSFSAVVEVVGDDSCEMHAAQKREKARKYEKIFAMPVCKKCC